MGLLRKEDMHESFWKEGVSNPNLLINGDFQVWQRGTSFLHSTGYTADRWFCSDEDANVTKDIYNNKDCLKISVADIQKEINFEQRIEGAYKLGGKTLTLSWECEVSEDVTISYLVYTFDEQRLAICNGDLNYNSGSIQKQSITFTVPTSLTSDYICVRPIRRMSKKVDALYLYNVKLELGTVATAFSPRPYGEELALCQRYYENSTNVLRGTIGAELFRLSFNVQYKQTKRVIPTLKIYGYNHEEGTVAGKIDTFVNCPIRAYSNTVNGFGALDITDKKGQSFVTGEMFEMYGWEANAEIY